MDTSTDRLSIALRSGSVLHERALDGARRHAAALVPLIEELLRDAGVSLEQVERLAVADGPGGFTGLRVSAALAKGLARTRPTLSVWSASTLMVRAAAAAAPAGPRVLVVTSALRGEVYAAEYRAALPHSIETLLSPRVATVESLRGVAPDLLIADAPDKIVDRFVAEFSVPLIHGTASFPHAAALISLIEIPGGATELDELDDWEPFYGRPAEAQARWEEAHGRALPDPARSER